MEISEKLKTFGQEHLLLGMAGLNEADREAYINQLETIDLSVPQHLHAKREERGMISPIEGLDIAAIEKNLIEFERAGIEAIRAGEVAAVLLAGGQGTRLGFNGPKGTFDMGTAKRPRYIFQLLIENLLDVCVPCGAYVPLFIMTSEKNDAETKAFFTQHNYFGYPAEYVRFFVQEMYPCTDFEGKILLEGRGKIALSPNGNGGWFTSLRRAGIMKDFPNVKWYNVFGVDNVLQRIADPAFVGATILSGKPCGAKYVRKTRWSEKVGLLCAENGEPAVIEYYELPEALAKEKDEYGNLKYRFGMTLNYLFAAELLEKIASKQIPIHAVKKVIPHLDETGNVVTPSEPNGYKFETLILDMVRLAGACLPFEVIREDEFAPVKNSKGKDSVNTAKRMLRRKGKI